MKTESLRSDLNIIQNWVKKNSRIIDLGCGDGELLSYLKNEKQCKGYGLEINPDSIVSCVEKG
jgi:methionine biosynthesis protein MetW